MACTPAPGHQITLDEDQVLRTFEENRLSVQSALFRRDSFPENVWFDPRAQANEDWEFALRLVQHTKILEDAEPVLLAFTSADSISTNRRKKLTGHLLVLKKNRHLASRYPTAYGKSQYAFGRGLWNIGKKRFGIRFMLEGLRAAPFDVLGSLVQTARRRTFNSFKNALGR